MNAPPGGFARTYGVELLYDALPELSPVDLLRAIRRYCPEAEPMGASGRGDAASFSFVHPDHLVTFADGAIPAQTHLLPSDKPFRLTETSAAALGQSWSFPEARKVVKRCRSSLLMTDLMSSGLDYRDRIELFQSALAGVLQLVPALAIHWRPTGQFVDPRRYLEAFDDCAASRFRAGALNVRFSTISDSPGDMVMDTLGLAALGLPDLQCHYRDLDPTEVATLLANTGYYLFERGDVIADGHTLEGLPLGNRWRCRHEDSLLPPSRVVLDLDPGSPYAAGTRS